MPLQDALPTACPWCSSTPVKKDGHDSPLSQRFRCHSCRRTFTDRTTTPFAGHRWPLDVIVTAVRWYLLYRLSAANVRDLLAERNIDVSARCVLRWVQKFGPLLAEGVRRQARPARRRWWCDETYVRVAGHWAYLYRAIDQRGQVIDVLLRENRDLASARAFFARATERRGVQPTQVVTDKHIPYVQAVRREAASARHIRTGLHRAKGRRRSRWSAHTCRSRTGCEQCGGCSGWPPVSD
jgi:transposase-like protein